MLFILAGVFCIVNLSCGWFPLEHGITPDGELVGACVMILCGVVDVQTTKIIKAIKEKEK